MNKLLTVVALAAVAAQVTLAAQVAVAAPAAGRVHLRSGGSNFTADHVTYVPATKTTTLRGHVHVVMANGDTIDAPTVSTRPLRGGAGKQGRRIRIWTLGR